MRLYIFVLLSTTAICGKAYDWRDYHDSNPPCFAHYFVWPTIPRDLCLTTYAASSDAEVTLEECDFGQDPPHPQIWYSNRRFRGLIKTSMDVPDWRTANDCLLYAEEGPNQSWPVYLGDCDEILFYDWHMNENYNIFWDRNTQMCLIPETKSCPAPGDHPVMSGECEQPIMNDDYSYQNHYGYEWHIRYVEPARARNSIYLISKETILQDDDGIIEVADGTDTIKLDQQRDGNFKVMRNNDVIFHTISRPEESLDYYTELQGDCNLVTYLGTPPSFYGEGMVWKSDIHIDHVPAIDYRSNPDCFLALNKDDDTLSIYVGTPDKVFAELWNSDW